MLKNLQQIPQQLLPQNLITNKSRSKKRKELNWGRYVRYLYWRFIRLRGNPEYIARGLAVGVFAGCFPIFGVQTIFGIALATLLRGHKFAAAAGTWISNPLTYIPIYTINFQIGRFLLNSQAEFVPESLVSLQEILQYKTELITALFSGCLVMGIIAGLSSYFMALKLITIWRSNYRYNLNNNGYNGLLLEVTEQEKTLSPFMVDRGKNTDNRKI